MLALAGLLYSSYHSTIEREETNLRNLAAAYAAQTHYATLALDMALAGDVDGAAGPAASTVDDELAAEVYVLGPDGQRRASRPALHHGNNAPAPVSMPG